MIIIIRVNKCIATTNGTQLLLNEVQNVVYTKYCKCVFSPLHAMCAISSTSDGHDRQIICHMIPQISIHAVTVRHLVMNVWEMKPDSCALLTIVPLSRPDRHIIAQFCPRQSAKVHTVIGF